MARRKPSQQTEATNLSPFRLAERTWKTRTAPLDLSRALEPGAIVWSESTDANGRQQGVWNGAGTSLEIWRIPVDEMKLGEMGQSKWKGKQKEQEGDWALVLPSMSGLVILPSILPPPLQRSLSLECMRHTILPNLTSLSAHYTLPSDGLWSAWTSGRGDETVPRHDADKVEVPRQRTRVDFEPVTTENWTSVKDRGEGLTPKPVERSREASEERRETTVGELLSKLRWTTIGLNYDWTSKVYDFENRTPLPPLIYRCCRDVVRALQWETVFGATASSSVEESVEEGDDWNKWSTEYEPEAGIINFYQLKDSLTAHIDQSEVDAIRPLVSFSIGHSAIFLVGGPTRDTAPLAIHLRSGDGLIMSGRAGRRVFHGVPRVLEDSLPPYLSASAELEPDEDEWRLCGEYLERGARINVNVRAVF